MEKTEEILVHHIFALAFQTCIRIYTDLKI